MTLPQLISLIALLVAFGIFLFLIHYTRNKKIHQSNRDDVDHYLRYLDVYVEPVIIRDLLLQSSSVEDYYSNARLLSEQLSYDAANSSEMSTKYSTDIRLYSHIKNIDSSVLFYTIATTIINKPVTEVTNELVGTNQT